MAKSVRIMLGNVRCTFPKLFVAEEFMGKKNYSVGLLLPEGSDLLAKIEQAAVDAVESQYPGKAAQMLKKFKGSRQSWPLRELDDGGFVITPKRREDQGAPLVIDQKKNLIPADKGLPYGGCYINASIDIFCYNKNGGGVTAYLNGVQLVKEGDPLSGAATAASCRDDFEALEETAGDDDDLL